MGRPVSYDRTAVLGAAERTFRHNGYTGTSLDDLGAATHLGRGSLYAGFGDKHALFMESLRTYIDRNETSVVAALDGPDEEALARVCHFIVAATHFVRDDPDHEACMIGKFALELGGVDQDATSTISQAFDRLHTAIADALTAARRNGDLERSADAPALATLILATARGTDILAKGGRSSTSLEAGARQLTGLLPVTPKGKRAVTRFWKRASLG